MNIYPKRAEAPLVYTIDWGKGWLGDAAIVASRWSVEPVDATEMVVGPDAGEGRTRASVSGGELGRRYRLSGHVLLSDGRTGTRSLAFAVAAR